MLTSITIIIIIITIIQCMDDVAGNEYIAELFADKYIVLYNSVCSNNDQLKELL